MTRMIWSFQSVSYKKYREEPLSGCWLYNGWANILKACHVDEGADAPLRQPKRWGEVNARRHREVTF